MQFAVVNAEHDWYAVTDDANHPLPEGYYLVPVSQASHLSRSYRIPAKEIAPADFLARFRPEEIVAVALSNDPTVIIARTRLQTVTGQINLVLPDTSGYVHHLESLGLIGVGRAVQILDI